MRMIIPSILFLSLVLSSCAESPSPIASVAPAFSQAPAPTGTNILSTTAVINATSTLTNKTIVLTPDDLFSLPGLKAWNTPDSEDFCEHLPSPQIVTTLDKLPLLSGRFVLCIYERINTALDLDTGSLVSTDDERGDIVMGSGRWGYGVFGWNNAYVNDAYVLEKYANHSGVNHLSSAYCENMLRGQTDGGGINVEEEKIACVRTTAGRIAIIRVERIYPLDTLSVEFSFALLRTVIATPAITPTATLTPGPSPTTTNTPTDQELLDALDKRTRALFDMPASEVIDFLHEIQDSLRTGNKEKLASLVYYPITIYRFEGDNDKQIQTAEEFIINYEKIVTPEWKEIILSQEPARLFTNWQGAMVSRGELWFTAVCTDKGCRNTKLYIVTINHTDW